MFYILQHYKIKIALIDIEAIFILLWFRLRYGKKVMLQVIAKAKQLAQPELDRQREETRKEIALIHQENFEKIDKDSKDFAIKYLQRFLDRQD